MKKICDPDVTRTRNLSIWSRTRYQLRHGVCYSMYNCEQYKLTVGRDLFYFSPLFHELVP